MESLQDFFCFPSVLSFYVGKQTSFEQDVLTLSFPLDSLDSLNGLENHYSGHQKLVVCSVDDDKSVYGFFWPGTGIRGDSFVIRLFEDQESSLRCHFTCNEVREYAWVTRGEGEGAPIHAFAGGAFCVNVENKTLLFGQAEVSKLCVYGVISSKALQFSASELSLRREIPSGKEKVEHTILVLGPPGSGKKSFVSSLLSSVTGKQEPIISSTRTITLGKTVLNFEIIPWWDNEMQVSKNERILKAILKGFTWDEWPPTEEQLSETEKAISSKAIAGIIFVLDGSATYADATFETINKFIQLRNGNTPCFCVLTKLDRLFPQMMYGRDAYTHMESYLQTVAKALKGKEQRRIDCNQIWSISNLLQWRGGKQFFSPQNIGGNNAMLCLISL